MEKKSRSMPSYIPEEILIQILINLPVKSILRFKSVSRSWNSIVRSHGFIYQHHDHQKSQLEKNYLLIGNAKKSFCLKDDLSLFFKRDQELLKHSDIKFPRPSSECVQFHGSCDGLLCFSTGQNRPIGMSWKPGLKQPDLPRIRDLFVWNPATKQCLQIPTPRHSYCNTGINRQLGLGFHPGTNDYKLISFHWCCRKERNNATVLFTEAEVYSLRQKSWKNLGIIAKEAIWPHGPSVVINGVFYWCIGPGFHSRIEDLKKWNKNILAFDMESERFQDINFPDGFDEGVGDATTFLLPFSSTSSESLALCVFGYRIISCTIDVWLADFYESDMIWTKRYKIEVQNPYRRHPLGFSHDREILVVARSGELISCNLRTGKWEYTWREWKREHYHISTRFLGHYVESLVPLSE